MTRWCVTHKGWLVLICGLCLTSVIYLSGLSGGWLFDDYPNIVDNPAVQPHDLSLPSLARAVLSSPASDFKRPIASLSFALNYAASGLDPYWMKLTNLIIHLINGCLIFLLARGLLKASTLPAKGTHESAVADFGKIGFTAALITTAWLLLPINLTCVLYVVQRMESMANAFVLIGLIGYIAGRGRMLSPPTTHSAKAIGFLLCAASIVAPTVVGALAKETAIMLPLYAALVEWILFKFRNVEEQRDIRITSLFLVTLVLPAIAGIAWLIPKVMDPAAWATRDFTLGTRLLSEARIVIQYIGWTFFPKPTWLSFYHDDFVVSSGLLHPFTTLLGMLALVALIAIVIFQRNRHPLLALGVAFYLGCQLLTATIVPLELVYEHRNYFASFGLLLAVIPLLVPNSHKLISVYTRASEGNHAKPRIGAICRYGVIFIFIAICAKQTAFTAFAWGNPLRLADELATRAPNSPRAQYELGRTLIIYSNYDPASPYTSLAYAPLERAAALPSSSILPQQALIFMNSRMGLPVKDAWWDSLIAKLRARPSGVQDDSSLVVLAECAKDGSCILPQKQMVGAFEAALSHPNPSARLLSTYGDYAWNVMNNHILGENMISEAIKIAPREPAYRITLIRMLVAEGRSTDAKSALIQLQSMNIGGALDGTLLALHQLPALQ